jgi:imidazolonepropionase-like amidohydrolase
MHAARRTGGLLATVSADATMIEYLLRGANVLDASGGFSGPTDVHVRNGRVEAVGANLRVADAPAADFSNLWLMPGVFDCHDHLSQSWLTVIDALRTPITERSLEAADNARRTLLSGITFVRDAGGTDSGIRNGIEKGYVPGPRLQVSLTLLSQTGGCMDGYLAGPGLALSTEYFVADYPGRPPFLVDGVDEMRKAVREHLRLGADWIKICTTGALLSPHNEPDTPEFTLEEVCVAVAEAARQGKSVFSHAYGGDGVDVAIEAGVRSIEHGTFITEAQADAMARAGCWLVPTLSTLTDAIDWADSGPLPPYAVRKAARLKDALGEAVPMARDHGVRIAAGTDTMSRDKHGSNLRELLLLHRAGLTVEEALLAGTADSAELCGVGHELGRIAPGYLFDAIVFDEELGDLSILGEPGSVTGVFKNGEPVLSHRRLDGLSPSPREARVVDRGVPVEEGVSAQ